MTLPMSRIEVAPVAAWTGRRVPYYEPVEVGSGSAAPRATVESKEVPAVIREDQGVTTYQYLPKEEWELVSQVNRRVTVDVKAGRSWRITWDTGRRRSPGSGGPYLQG